MDFKKEEIFFFKKRGPRFSMELWIFETHSQSVETGTAQPC